MWLRVVQSNNRFGKDMVHLVAQAESIIMRDVYRLEANIWPSVLILILTRTKIDRPG